MADLDTLLATAPAGSKDAAAKTAHADQVLELLLTKVFGKGLALGKICGSGRAMILLPPLTAYL